MAVDTEQILVEKFRALPAGEQQKVLAYAADLQNQIAARSRPIWEVVTEISSRIPLEEWDAIPSDAAANLDYYLYAAAKK